MPERRVQITTADLMGATEAAAYVEISRQRVGQLRREKRFPPPYVRLSCGPIWLRRDLDEWLTKVTRVPGRPRVYP